MAIGFSNAARAHMSDFNPGTGATTMASTNPNVISAEASLADPGTVVAPGMAGTTQGHPVTWWFAIIVILLSIKFLSEKGGTESEYKNIRVGFFNIITITLSAIVGLIALKWVFGLYKIPGISDIVLAA